MFFLTRLIRSSTHPLLKWGIVALLIGLGLGLTIWGLVDRNYIFVVRGVLELVIVAFIVFRIRTYRPRNQSRDRINLP